MNNRIRVEKKYRIADTENFLKMASWSMENYHLVLPQEQEFYKPCEKRLSFLKRLDPAGLQTCELWHGTGNDSDTFFTSLWACQMKGKRGFEEISLVIDKDLFKASTAVAFACSKGEMWMKVDVRAYELWYCT